ncbi:MAG: hypothetical protein ACLRXP_14285 [Oscillospiraceae bacterium]
MGIDGSKTSFFLHIHSCMQHIVGADAHIGPFRSCEFAKILCGTGLPCRADVGIGPYSGNGSRLLPQILRALAEKVKFFSFCTKRRACTDGYALFFHINEYL